MQLAFGEKQKRHFRTDLRRLRVFPGMCSAILLLTLFNSQVSMAEGQVLQGVASIIGAASPAVVAGIKASSQAAIAGINAQASLATTRIAAEASKSISTDQKEVALAQTFAALNINRQNQQGVTDRLSMQLAELRSAREQASALDREKLQYERELNRARIDLAKKQADANLKLAEMTLSAQLTQAGLTTGFQRKDSSKGLSVTSLSGNRAGPSVSSSGGPSLAAVATNPPQGSSRLLSSLNSSPSTAGRTRAEVLSSFTSTRSAAAQADSRLRSAIQGNGIARGSMPGARLRTESSVVSSDLVRFQRSSAGQGFLPHRGASAPSSGHTSTSVSTHSTRSIVGKY